MFVFAGDTVVAGPAAAESGRRGSPSLTTVRHVTSFMTNTNPQHYSTSIRRISVSCVRHLQHVHVGSIGFAAWPHHSWSVRRRQDG
jgi:K+-transporting ATPase A subunit